MELSLLAIPILIVAILYAIYVSTQKKKTHKKAHLERHTRTYKSPKRKFDLKSLESRVRRRMAVST